MHFKTMTCNICEPNMHQVKGWDLFRFFNHIF